MSALPPCGVYRTRVPISDAVPAGRLVYFHNHGDPGPGVYLPRGWVENRAQWHAQGITLPDAAAAETLEPLRPEGFYRVREAFFCCDKRCRQFEAELLVQLGYDGQGGAIVFVPEWTAEGLRLPKTGQAVDAARTALLDPLKVAEAPAVAQARGLMH
jgi:hypothetical protein